MTTNGSQSTTEPRHWSNETAADAVQAAMEARALMLATARALGLPDERVEDAPQEAERLRTQLAQIRAILTGLLADVGIETTDDVVRLAAQVRALVRALEADRAAIVEPLLATGVEPASSDPVQLAYQVRELVRELRAERGEARAELRRIQALVERLRLEVPNLREQVRKLLTMDEATILLVEAERVINQGIITRLTAALREILHEAESDFDRDIIATAARGALKAVDA